MIATELLNLVTSFLILSKGPFLVKCDFCESHEKETGIFDCPNVDYFNVNNEFNKPDGTWKLDLAKFNTTNISEILRQIKLLTATYQKCPFIRSIVQRKCCPGYTGVSCAIPIYESPRLTQVPIPVNRTTSFSTCLMWGIDHFRTFDGFEFTFSGKCQYIVAGDNKNWQILMQPVNCYKWETCLKRLVMNFDGLVFTALGDDLLHNNTLINDTFSLAGIQIYKKESYWYLKYSLGVRVRWNSEAWVFVSLESNLKDKTRGICGDFNDMLYDDLRLPNNQVSLNKDEFGNEWRLDSQCPLSNTTNPCTSLAIKQAGEKACSSMLDFKWDKCLNRDIYYDNCVWDYCLAIAENTNGSRVICKAFEALSRKCYDNGILFSWRNSSFCPKLCPNNKTYSECASNCQKTCINRNQDSSLICSQDCFGGCICQEGTFIDTGRNNQCVQPSDCMCLYQNRYYDPKSIISVDCNKCICSNGFWNCTNNRCPRLCTVLGAGHYRTFDGNTYDLIDTCGNYTLIEDFVDKILRIEYTNHQLVSSLNRLLRITSKSNVLVIFNNTLSFNNNKVTQLPYLNSDISVQKQDPDFWIVRTNGARVLFDGIRIYISLKRNYENKVRGLCGTLTYNSEDDFLTPYGMIEKNTDMFANFYRNNASCINRRTAHCRALESTSRNICDQLRDYSCGLDPEYYIQICLNDLCLDSNTQYGSIFRCSAFAAYAFECAKLGNPLLDWLTTLNCSDNSYGRCPSNKKYTDCINECNSTCSTLSAKGSSCDLECVPGCSCDSKFPYLDERTNQCVAKNSCYCKNKEKIIAPNVTVSDHCSNCSCINGVLQCTYRSPSMIKCPPTQLFSFNASKCPLTCENYPDYRDCGIYFSGCTCPKDHVLLNITTCIPKEQCPCKQGGNLYPPGYVLNRECQSCTCSSGFWSCVRRTCDGICRATGDPHYVTFDNFAYSFQGDCKYVLLTTNDNSLEIIAENVKCAADGSTCTKSIEIVYQNYTIILRRGMETFVNGIRVDFFFQAKFFPTDLTISIQGVLQVVKASHFELRWDGAQNVYILAKPTLREKTKGLCGNYNGLKDDDLIARSNVLLSGGNSGNIIEFAHSWRIDSSCEAPGAPKPPCSQTEYRRQWAEEKCELLRNSSIGAPFRECNRYLSKDELDGQYKNCLYDACNCNSGDDCSCLCSTFSQFAEYCKQLNHLVQWRSNELCPIQCEGDLRYDTCGPVCQPSCFDNKTLICENTTRCFEGCFCPPGTYLDNKRRCLKDRSECSCIDPKTGQIYENGEIFARDNCTLCECKGGEICCSLVEQCQCKKDEVLCQDQLKCINQDWICDGEFDCIDQSDELNCTCKRNEFTCRNGECVLELLKCDGKSDCIDGSDEFSCFNQSCFDSFQCLNGKCVPIDFVCDREDDCGDMSDEIECPTRGAPVCLTAANFTPCKDGSGCISNSLLCDGHLDCKDESDEKNCIAPTSNVICSANIFNSSNFTVVIRENFTTAQFLVPFTFPSSSNNTLTIGIQGFYYHNVTITVGDFALYNYFNVTFLDENGIETTDINEVTGLFYQTPDSETSTAFTDDSKVFFMRIVFLPIANRLVGNVQLIIIACLKPLSPTFTIPIVTSTKVSTLTSGTTSASTTYTSKIVTTLKVDCNTELNDTLVSEVTTIPDSPEHFLTDIYEGFNGEVLPLGTRINITLIGLVSINKIGIPNSNSNVRQISVQFFDKLNRTIILPDNSTELLSNPNDKPIISSNLPTTQVKYILITIRSLIDPLLNATIKVSLIGCYENGDFNLIPSISNQTTLSTSSTTFFTTAQPSLSTTTIDYDADEPAEGSYFCAFNQAGTEVVTDIFGVIDEPIFEVLPSGVGISLGINEAITVLIKSEFNLVYLKEVGLTFTDRIRRITGIEVRLTDKRNRTIIRTNANSSSSSIIINSNLPRRAIATVSIRITNISGPSINDLVTGVKVTVKGCYSNNITSLTTISSSTTSKMTISMTTSISTTLCPIGDWQLWSECDRTCGPGSKIRIRYIVENGTCQYQEEATPCTVANCTCDISESILQRYNLSFINNQTKEIGWIEKDGVSGLTSLNESVRIDDSVTADQLIFLQNCKTLKCLENGSLDLTNYFENYTLSEWSEWSNCDGICGIAKKNRTRKCLAPKCLSIYSLNCTGSLIEFGNCECSSTTTLKMTSISSQACYLPNNSIILENQTTILQDSCNVCLCSKGVLNCSPLICNETEASCLNKSNENLLYEFIPKSNNSCCGQCRVRFNTTCSVVRLPDDFVNFNSSCTSLQRVRRQECFGTCFSSHQSFIQNGLTNKQCRCCSPNQVSIEDIQVNCNNGRVIPVKYTHILSCVCRECPAIVSNMRYPIY